MTVAALFCNFWSFSSEYAFPISQTRLQWSKWGKIIELYTEIRVDWGTKALACHCAFIIQLWHVIVH